MKSVIRVAGHEYDVKLVPADHPNLGVDTAGRYNSDEEYILVLETQKPLLQRKTLFHELIHCADYHYNPDETKRMTEEQVVAIENGLWAIFSDNPGLARTLFGKKA